MTQAAARQHWIAEALNYFGISSDIPAGLTAINAWRAAEDSSGLTADDLTRKIAARLKLGVADLSAADPRILKLVPEKLARLYTIFPLSATDRHLSIATSDPKDLAAEQAIAFASGRSLIFRIADPGLIKEVIDQRYSPERLVEGLLANVDSEINYTVRVVETGEPENLDKGAIEAAPIVKLTNVILRDGARQGASDIHIEPNQGMGIVRFRVDGILRSYMQIPLAALSRVVSRFKVLGRMDITERRRPQDGRSRVHIEGKTYDLRLSTVPTRDSEKAVIRILNPDTAKSLEDLAMPASELARFRKLLSNREGMILVTGPTGSGKTTTLYAALKELSNGKVNITTVEDPIEYELAGVTQIQVESKQDVTFANALRAVLRQDPDVILVGEIRDLDTARMGVQASMTGHVVLSTLHTNDAASVFGRLIDIGLDAGSIASTLRGVVAQRLVRRVCADCVETISGKLRDEETRLESIYGVRPLVRARGCEQCGHTGYRGRIPVQEVLVMNTEMQEAITRGTSLNEIQHIAIRGGMRPMRATAIDRAAQGQTTLEELDRVLGDTGEAPAAVPSSDKPQVLIVDDDPINRRIARSLLDKQGYNVTEAEDGVAALEQIEAGHAYALIILDLSMPRLGGRELLRRIRSSPSTVGTPVVVLTSSGDQVVETLLMEEGADDFIRKPLDPSRFSARIRAVLRRSAA